MYIRDRDADESVYQKQQLNVPKTLRKSGCVLLSYQRAEQRATTRHLNYRGLGTALLECLSLRARLMRLLSSSYFLNSLLDDLATLRHVLL